MVLFFMNNETIKKEELEALHIEIRNSLSEAIVVMEQEGAQMPRVTKDPNFNNVNYLTKSRMNLLHQKNKLKEVYELMGSLLHK